MLSKNFNSFKYCYFNQNLYTTKEIIEGLKDEPHKAQEILRKKPNDLAASIGGLCYIFTENEFFSVVNKPINDILKHTKNIGEKFIEKLEQYTSNKFNIDIKKASKN